VRLPPAYGKRQDAGLRSRRAVICASLLGLAFAKESCRLSRAIDTEDKALHQSEFPLGSD
jgi:hypothetical protein